MIKPSRISFGGTAGIVTSMALIAGLDAAKTGRASMVSALLIAAVADNLTDSLSVHMYQESERLEQKEAMDRDCPTVEGHLSLQDFVQEYLLRSGRRCFAVVQNGRLSGLVTPREVEHVDRLRSVQFSGQEQKTAAKNGRA